MAKEKPAGRKKKPATKRTPNPRKKAVKRKKPATGKRKRTTKRPTKRPTKRTSSTSPPAGSSTPPAVEYEPDPDAYPFLDGIVHPKKRAFLRTYCETFNLTKSATLVGLSRHSHYWWMAKDPVYAAAFEAAKPIAAEALEAELTRRAFDGVRKLKFHQGEVITIPCDPDHPDAIQVESPSGRTYYARPYVEHEYSDTLGIFLLKGAMPERYRERYDINDNAALLDQLEEAITEATT